MADVQLENGRITIIEIINGIHKLQLYNALPASQFTFFMGLICKANELGFKETISLTNSAAMALAGVESRQSINRLRTALSKFKVDGEKLLEFSHGNHSKNVAAKYKINYNLLIRQNRIWQGFDARVSQKRDGSGDGSGDACVPFLRSDQKREEKIKSDQEAVPDSDFDDDIMPPDFRILQKTIQDKYSGRIACTDTHALDILRLYPEGGLDFWEYVVDKMPEYDNLKVKKSVVIKKYGEKMWVQYKKANNIQQLV